MSRNSGFIQVIVIVVLIIIVISLLGISLKGIFDKLSENKILGDNFSYAWDGIKNFFNTYLYSYVASAGSFIFNIMKEPFLRVLSQIGK